MTPDERHEAMIVQIEKLEQLVRDYREQVTGYDVLYKRGRAWGWIERGMALEKRANELVGEEQA